RLIETPEDVAEGCAWLAGAEPRFADAYRLTGLPPLRRRLGGFGPLLQIVCGQQLSTASAAACWRRLEEAGGDRPDGVLALGEPGLRDCGLSRPKARYALALAETDIDFPALTTLPEDEALARLTALRGIGPWTAEIYLMTCIGRADVFAPGDLALQEASKVLFDLPERPAEKAMRAIAAEWSPWRAVAARLLWAYYRVIKNRDGIAE
ncbi:MAG: DNA-3-methyladenine glycosylase 2 family protein, partial [Pseudomonadota bacterium]